jgi:hypothetical protein
MIYMEQILNNEWGIYKIDFPNGTIPENASISDVLNNKAKSYIKV